MHQYFQHYNNVFENSTKNKSIQNQRKGPGFYALVAEDEPLSYFIEIRNGLYQGQNATIC